MKYTSLALAGCVFLFGCAEQRINGDTAVFYKDMDHYSYQEIIDNLDAQIDDEFRIPTRTTFGKGNLTTTDNAQATATVPFQFTPTSAGTAGANIGMFVDTFQIAIVPDTDGDNLAKLRDIYRAAVFPDKYNLLSKAIPIRNSHWLKWTNDTGFPSGHEPSSSDFPIGHGAHHQLFVSDRQTFSDFILLTKGHVSVTAPAVKKPGRVRPGEHRSSPPPTYHGHIGPNPAAPGGGETPPAQNPSPPPNPNPSPVSPGPGPKPQFVPSNNGVAPGKQPKPQENQPTLLE